MKLVVGLCGRARHGKDLVAAEMQRQFEGRGQRSFILPVSTIIFEKARAMGIINAPSRERLTPHEIDVLVQLGRTEREKNPYVWVDELAKRVAGSSDDVALIPGMRFVNEVQWLLSGAAGVLVRVTRLNTNGSLFVSTDRDPNDPMETSLRHVVADFELVTHEGKTEWLEAQARCLANHLFAVRQLDDEPRVAVSGAPGIAWG